MNRTASAAVDRGQLGVVSKSAARDVDRRDLLLDGRTSRLEAAGIGGEDHGPGAQGPELEPPGCGRPGRAARGCRHHDPPEVAWVDPLEKLDELGLHDGDWS